MTTFRNHSKAARVLETLTLWTDHIAANRSFPISLDTIPTASSRQHVYPSTVYRWWHTGRLPIYFKTPTGHPLFLTNPFAWHIRFVNDYSSWGYMAFSPSDISNLTGVSASRITAMLDAHPERYRRPLLINRGTRVTPAWLLAPHHLDTLKSMGLTRDAN